MVFKRRKRKTFIHEDEYRQQELLPLGDLDYCVRKFMEIDRARGIDVPNEEELGDNSYEKLGLIALGLLCLDVKGIVETFFPPFDVFETGSYTDRFESNNTIAFGSETGTRVLIETDQTRHVVESVWFDFCGDDKDECSMLNSVFQILGESHELIYVDWRCRRLFKLGDNEEFSKYVSTLQG